MAHMMRTLAVTSVLAILLAGCPKSGATAVDDIARGLSNNFMRQRPGVNQPAVQNQFRRTLRPLESVDDQQQQAFEAACYAKDLVKVGQADSVEEAVVEVMGMRPSPGARRKAVEDIAQDLLALNRNPDVVDGISVTGDMICLLA